jgi:TRAP-type uncharacterized transport system substrate-binding protein
VRPPYSIRTDEGKSPASATIRLMVTRARVRGLPGLAAAGAILMAGALVWLLATQRPMPPRTLLMATGAEGEAYADVAPRYRELLGRAGVEVRLVPTAGSAENLERLRDPKSGVSVAFVQGGLATAQDSANLSSLGTMFFEPLWIFYRGPRGKGIEAVVGNRVSIGPSGSGTQELVLRLLALGHLDPGQMELVALDPGRAADELLRGDIYAAVMLTSWDSPVVRTLLGRPGVALASIFQADAFVALDPALYKLVLPAGMGDLAREIPPTDVLLLATKTSLVVRSDLHPALQFLLLEAASEIHGGRRVFHRSGQFPAAEGTDLPLSPQAREYYKTGPPWLQRHLPFWLAVLMDRFVVILIPVATILYPALRFLPAAYSGIMQGRILRLYGELKLLEDDLDRPGGAPAAGELAARLEGLERRASRARLPQSFAPSLYTLKHHISLVHERLEKRAGLPAGDHAVGSDTRSD